MSEVHFARCVAVTFDGCKGQPWIVQDIELVSGIEFISLKSSCSGFCRFASGKRRFSGQGGTKVLSELQHKRTTATLEHTVKHNCGESIFEELMPTRGARKKAKRNAKSSELPQCVSVTLPAFVNTNGDAINGIEANMIPELDCRNSIPIEFPLQT